jgi:glycolate oxidase FAD binding subunit
MPTLQAAGSDPEPKLLGRPHDFAELAALLAQATAERLAVTPWGAGTRQHLGRLAAPGAYRLELGALDRVIDYVPEDLTITLEAGVTIGAAQKLLAARGQWLPWDPPGGEAATIGGLLASGASGALRLSAGTPRDWVLGMQVVLADGRSAKSGGRVVKNVAGYDMHKLHLGALGTLGVIAEVTLKVMPLPEQQASLLAGFDTLAQTLSAAEVLRASPLAPLALALTTQASARLHPVLADFSTCQESHFVLLARFGGAPLAVSRQVRLAVQRAEEQGAKCLELTEAEGGAAWAALSELLEGGRQGVLLRCGHPVAQLEAALAALGMREPSVELLALPGAGLAWLRLPATTGAQLVALRAPLVACGAYLVVEDAPASLRASLDIWGPPPPGIALMRQLKHQWDPASILNRGRYVLE